MDEENLADLKQFIAVTIHQELTDVRSDIKIIKSDITRLDKKIDDRIDEVLAAVADSTNNRFEVIEQDVSELQTRVTTLETAK